MHGKEQKDLTSAVSARSVSHAEGVDRVRALQRVLYRCAKQDRDRRFHALFDKVARSDVMERAWGEVRANRGAAGIDGVTIDEIESSGAGEFLEALAAGLRAGRYRPRPLRRVHIPKPGRRGETRPLRPDGGRPGGDGGGEDRARADLRGRLPAHELRVSAPAVGPPRPGDGQADRHLARQAVGARRRHPKLLGAIVTLPRRSWWWGRR